MSESENHSDSSHNWLTFFFVCFVIVQAIGIWAIFSYNVNAPEPKPGGGGGHGMSLPHDQAPNLRITLA